MNDNANIDVVIKPRIRPRGIGDMLVCLLIPMPLQVTGLNIIPAFLIYIAFHSETLALLLVVAINLIFLSYSVWSITLTSNGICFNRILGTPKFLPWSELVSIAIAPRRELIVKGWLWPLFPAREMTASLTALGHYRISWHGGFCYYPPSDPTLFESYVSRHFRNGSAA
jgi:hypothetical protein